MPFTLTRNFKVHFHGDQEKKSVLSYYVMILGVIYSFYFGECVSLLKDHVI